jgi:thioredoxin-like negative regulator of GroEL
MAASLSQSLSSFVIPTSERTDPEPVRSSLALARADFERGELRDALKHLRRAAEEADDAGSELRAVALARAAADLATEVGSTLTPPPVVAAPSAAPSAAPVSMVRGSADAALEQLLASGRAVKVVVKRSARDEELYVLRRADGHAPALGTREAVIVLLDAGADDGFFSPPKASTDAG